MLYDSHISCSAAPSCRAGAGCKQRRGRSPWGLSVCRDQVITSAAAFAVVLHAPAVQPAPHAGAAGRPQARDGFSRVAYCPAATHVLLTNCYITCYVS